MTLHVGGVLALLACGVAAAACDPMLSERSALYETTLQVQGRQPTSRSVRLPAGANVLVLAREQGVSVTITVTLDRTNIGLTDSAIERAGIQRLAFMATPGEYSITVAGKEDTAETGGVELRVLALDARAREDSCLQVQRMLAAADAAYASGKSVSDGTSVNPNADTHSSYQAAANQYMAVVANLEASGPSLQLAQAQHTLAALFYQDMDDWVESVKWADLAAQTYSAVGDAYGNARAQAVEAAALTELAVSPPPQVSRVDARRTAPEKLAHARAMLQTVVSFHARRNEMRDQASALNYIGLAYYYEGLNDDAIGVYRRALPLYESLGNRLRQAQLIQNIAVAEYELGRLSVAIGRYSQVLDLIRATESTTPVVFVLNNAAIANWASGNFDMALRQHSEALELARTTQLTSEQSRSLQGIGSVYDSLGDRAQALDYYNQALVLRSAATDGRGRTSTLRSIASVLREQGRFREALIMHREALSLATTPSATARIRVQVAKDLAASGQFDDASQELMTVLRESAEDDPVRGQAMLERSRLRMHSDDAAAAEADLHAAIKIFQSYEEPADEFAAWIELAHLKQKHGTLDDAFRAVDKALALAEEVRLQSANPELRASLMQPLRPAFDLKVSMLGAQYAAYQRGGKSNRAAGVAMEALQTAEQARTRALSDFGKLDLSAPGVSAQQAQQRQSLYRELAARRFQLEVRLDRSGTQDTRVRLLRNEIAGLRQQLDQIDAQIGAASAKDAGADPQRTAGPHKAIDLQAIPADTAIVEYWLGADEATAWVATREKLQMVQLGPTSRITQSALALHAALRSFGSVPVSERLRLGDELHGLVIRPMAAMLADKHQLIFAPDGALHYVPFAALRSVDATQASFLVERHDVAVASSIELLLKDDSSAHRAPPKKQMLLVDDPVYGLDDPRLSIAADVPARKSSTVPAWLVVRGNANALALPRLPGTQREADTISSLLPGESVDRLEGFTATRERFLAAGLNQYRFIHVASHAVTDSEIPQLSALILTSRDSRGLPIEGRVLAADFVNTQLNADVVVLSACDTALGKSVGGEGLVGLRYVVLARGARSVMASLWQVPDEAAAQLMTRFYSSLLRGGSTPIAASSAAMRDMLAGRLRDPALWAAFAIAVGPLRVN